MTPFLFQRLHTALSGSPDVLDELAGKIEADGQIWDFRPDPDRFTLREIVAHLADFEPIWLDRFERTKAHDGAKFERLDPGQMALDRCYADSNPSANLAAFRKGRQQLTEFMQTLTDEDWKKVSIMGPPSGPRTIEDQIVFVAVHDGYHTGQIARWLALGRVNV